MSPLATGKPLLGYGDYLRFSKLLLDRYGLSFPDHRRPELEGALFQAFAGSACSNLNEYYTLLQEQHDGGPDMERLANAVTINETHFFRDTAQFDALYETILPAIIEQRRPLRTLRIWSAGCSSGEEPYSIAMLLRELLPDVDQWSITILGTDINTLALDRARNARYGEWAFREPRAKAWRARYFAQEGRFWTLNPAVQHMVTFARLNLAEPGYPSYATNTMYMDLILCRNVTIYFSEFITLGVVDRLYEALVDNGWLVVGHSELSLDMYKRFQPRNFPHTVIYQRVSQPLSLPPDWNWSEAAPVPLPPPPLPPPPLPVPPAPVAVNGSDPHEAAQQALEFGRSEEARAVLLPVADTPAATAQTYTLLGQACANLGRFEEAERWCNRAVQHNKLALDAYYTLSLVLQHQGKLSPAIEAMKKVVYINHADILGHFGLAKLYHEAAQIPAALKSLDNARRLLAGKADDELVPRSGGVTVKLLGAAIVRQQQHWAGANPT